MNINQYIKKQKGFSLVELMITLAILSFTLAGIYSFYSFIQNGFARNNANNEVQQDASIFIRRFTDDIKMSQKPNALTKSVHVVSGGQVVYIYVYNTATKYNRIEYRLDTTDKTKMQRGIAVANDPTELENPKYDEITDWETVMSGVSDEIIFKDNTSGNSDKRLIQLSFKACDERKILTNPLNFGTTVMTRASGLKP